MPNPWARRARAWPIRPKPTMPRVLWWMSWPSIIIGPQIQGFLLRRNRAPPATRRAAARRRDQAAPAGASARASGAVGGGGPARGRGGGVMGANPAPEVGADEGGGAAPPQNP